MGMYPLALAVVLFALGWAVLEALAGPLAGGEPRRSTARGLCPRSPSWVPVPADNLRATRLTIGDWGVIEGQAPVWPAPRPPARPTPATPPRKAPTSPHGEAGRPAPSPAGAGR